jgi:hypothetical protein
MLALTAGAMGLALVRSEPLKMLPLTTKQLPVLDLIGHDAGTTTQGA